MIPLRGYYKKVEGEFKMKKKSISVLLVMIMLLSSLIVAGCGKTTASTPSTVSTKNVKIGLMIYNTDAQMTAIKAYYEQLAKEIGGMEFVFATADSMNAAANLTTCEALISQGCNGVITTVSTGLVDMAQACKEQNVFIAITMAKPDVADNDALSKLSNFLGGVTDGPVTGDQRGIDAAKFIIAKGYKNIGTLTFPLTVMVSHKESYDSFVKTINDYNATTTTANKITLVKNTELYFKPADASYFGNNKDIDCLYSLAAGITYAYPAMVQAGVLGKVKLVTVGIRFDADSYKAINAGDIAMTTFSSVEQNFYPVALIFDAINGQKYDDAPANGAIVGCSSINISGADQLTLLQAKSYFFRTSDDEISRLLLKPADAKMLLKTYNKDATYAGLTAYLSKLGFDAFK